MPVKVVVIDYGMGNLRSVQRKFERIGAHTIVSQDPTELSSADKIVLPGVGHFGKGVENLKKFGFWDALHEEVLVNQKCFLGICLGMQLLSKQSEEGNSTGLGWIDAEVVHFNVEDKLKYKVPHMGWNSLISQSDDSVLNGIDNKSLFYFVHSYHVASASHKDTLTMTNFEYDFVSAVVKENIVGFQFHPEKSHDTGETLLKNFLKR